MCVHTVAIDGLHQLEVGGACLYPLLLQCSSRADDIIAPVRLMDLGRGRGLLLCKVAIREAWLGGLKALRGM